MAKIRVLKRQSNSYIQLPQDMANSDEVELFQLKEGYYLLSLPLGQPMAIQAKAQPINERERAVLKKLLSIRFENRTPAYVEKTLSEQEKAVLKELERKGFVNVFIGSKYKDGVYNIRDSIYPLLSAKEALPTASVGIPKPSAQTSDTISSLRKQGFITLADKNEAKSLSDMLSQEMKTGAVVGVKGFDGKFYIVTRDYFNKAQAAIAAVLKEDLHADNIALAAKLDSEGCRAALRIMAENGDIIEKRKGIFAPV